MNLTGIWKPYGNYVIKDQTVTIQGEELTFWPGVADSNARKTTVPFHLEEAHSLRENRCYNIIIDEEQFKNTDFVVHEEVIDGKPVVILSQMMMEYDGRGRIVLFSYVREEDYALVNDDFKSLAFQYWNDRPSTPMTQMNPGATLSMGMMAGMAGMAGMMSGGMASAAVPNPVSKVEPWDCSCGKKQNTTKFCPECGMPMPK